jgi:hypothetical protein
MLVCNISLRPPRSAIAADVAEAATALDASTTGFVVFATLVDDPASVGDIVDAYLGEIMLEAASAADAIDAGMEYTAAIVEATTALAAQDGNVPAIYTDSVDETASAASAQDASITPAVAQMARPLSGSRAGIGSVVVFDDGSGKTQVIIDVGVVK